MTKIPVKFLTLILILDFSIGIFVVNMNTQLQLEEVDDKICEDGRKYVFFTDKSDCLWCKWVKSFPLKYYIHISLPDKYVIGTEASFNVWNDGIGTTLFEKTTSMNLADIIIKHENLGDGHENALAITSSYPGDMISDGIANSEIFVNQLYEFSDLPFSCELLPVEYGGPFDYTTVMVHEIGHVLGLDHTGDAFTTMHAYYIGTFQRTLSQGEIDGINVLYNI